MDARVAYTQLLSMKKREIGMASSISSQSRWFHFAQITLVRYEFISSAHSQPGVKRRRGHVALVSTIEKGELKTSGV